MPHLNTLAFVVVPKNSASNPTLIRRNRLVERLDEQKRLASASSYIPASKRWRKAPDGSKTLVDHYRRISPWWRKDESGNIVLTIKVGLKTLEFDKGKTGIALGAPERLEIVLNTLIAATTHNIKPEIEPTVRLVTTKWQQIQGFDPEINGKTPGADPNFNGGQRAEIYGGAIVDGKLLGMNNLIIASEIGVPFYQNLSGPQQMKNWQGALQLRYRY